jgi:hypothetical protein
MLKLETEEEGTLYGRLGWVETKLEMTPGLHIFNLLHGSSKSALFQARYF